jgi:methylenetetrahydrofolate dehydrogenase (NADP+) / methenyltetrahydrofolate cyclohydrolase
VGELISGKRIAREIRAKTAQRVSALKSRGVTPKLAVILVGEDKPSQTYVKKKGIAAKKVGMDFSLYELSGDISQGELEYKINTVQNDEDLSGLIVQLPLPVHIDTTKIVNMVRPEIDVDCLTDINLGRLVMKSNKIVPPTPGAVMSILHDLEVNDLIGKNVVIIGVGPLVGKPLAIMMINERASVTTCNSKTKDTTKKCLEADVIVTGVGRKDVLRGNMVKSGAIVVDTGVSFVDGKMYGDVNVEEVKEVAAHVTPTPGGVGPITVARLLTNTVICAEEIASCQ